MTSGDRARSVLATLGVLLVGGLAGCASNEARDRMIAVHGLATEVTAVVELSKLPADPPATLAAANEAVTSLLRDGLAPIVAHATVRYGAERTPEQTDVAASSVEAVLETPRIRAEETSATRKELTGKVVHFRFTLRRADAKLASDPCRVEVPVTVLEDSRAPADTITFPQDFRADLLDALVSAVAGAVKAHGGEPVAPRPVPTR